MISSLMLGLLLAAAGSVAGETGALAQGPTVRTWVSGCLRDAPQPGNGDSVDSCEGITISAGASSIVMEHRGAMLNCCTQVSVSVRVDGRTVRFVEGESGERCHCVCPYDLGAEVTGLEEGVYQVEVWSADGTLLCIREVEVRRGPPRLLFWSSACSDANGEPPPETVNFYACGRNIMVEHASAELNCCMELLVELDEEPGRFRLREIDRGDACFCMCRFDITAMVVGVDPGTYTVELVGVSDEPAGSAVVVVTGTGARIRLRRPGG